MRLLAVLLLLTSVFALGQNAVVSGRISDTQDAVIAGASIEILNRATGVRIISTANGEGYFVAPPLPPGVYDITVSAPGFSQAKIDAVTLEVGQSRTLNTQLTVGAIQDTITVTDTAPLLTANRADPGDCHRKQVCYQHSAQSAESSAASHFGARRHRGPECRDQHRKSVHDKQLPHQRRTRRDERDPDRRSGQHRNV